MTRPSRGRHLIAKALSAVMSVCMLLTVAACAVQDTRTVITVTGKHKNMIPITAARVCQKPKIANLQIRCGKARF